MFLHTRHKICTVSIRVFTKLTTTVCTFITVNIAYLATYMYMYISLSPLLQAVLWSNLFKYELELGHSQGAYQAMMDNPDPVR